MPASPPSHGFPAHRPFFLLAQAAAIVGGLVWLLPTEEPIRLHLTWLVFGMGSAAVAGYLLTALPSWTGHRASAATVWGLVSLWLVTRLLATFGCPADLAFIVADIAFHAVLMTALAVPVLRRRLWRKVPLTLAPAVLGAAELAFASAPHGSALPVAAVLLFAALISLVGGRAVPAFVGAALRSPAPPPAAGPLAPALIAGATGAVLVGAERAAGVLLAVVGLLTLARVGHWSVTRIRTHPGVAMLVLAWLWLGSGLGLLGAALIVGAGAPAPVTVGTAVHALTMGAMGSMIYAFTARATMLRTPGVLVPTRAQQIGFLLVLLSPVPRLVPWPDAPTGHAVAVLAWCLGWACLLARTIRTLQDPAPWPALSAAREVGGRVR